MTKKEKLKEFDQLTNWCIDNPIGVLHVARGMYRRLLDDIESRTCENCKHFSYNCKCDILICRILVQDTIGTAHFENRYPPVDKDFGCNKFERKEDG